MASFIVYNNKAEKIDSNSMENLLYMSSIINIFKDLFSKIEINNIIYNNVNNDNYLDNYLLEI